MDSQCIICRSLDTDVVYQNYQGYVDGSFFDIYKCSHCGSNFVNTKENINELYNVIYSSQNISGYDRYYHYLQVTKDKKNPLKFLADREPPYFHVYEYIKDRKDLRILEIGCGYGYLTYSLKKMGFEITGIDVSSAAVSFAKENFGNYFYNIDLCEFANKTTEKFDLIISTEVIEHIKAPNTFIDDCIKLLNEKGKILLTTPNIDFSPKGSVWQTDLPPIHLSWISKDGIKYLADNHRLKASFRDFKKYYPKNINLMVKYLRYRYLKPKQENLSKEGKPTNKSIIFKTSETIVHKMPLIRLPCNLIYNKLFGTEITLGAILEKIS